MSNSKFGCYAALAAIFVGAVLFLYGSSLIPGETVTTILLVAGFLLFVGGLGSLIPLWWRGRHRKDVLALQSTEAIARWQVSPEDVERFRAIDAGRRARLWSLKNALKVPKDVPPEGILVVVGENALAVADAYYEFGVSQFERLGEVTWHEGSPGFIELSSELDLSKGSTIATVRLPVPDAARSEAAKAVAHLRSKIDPSNRDNIYGKFGYHFQAAMQPTDDPHPMKLKGKNFLIGFTVVCLAVLGLIFQSVYLSKPSSEASLDPAAQQTEVVACEPKEMEDINAFFLRAAEVASDRDREVERMHRSLGGLCTQFFDRLLRASDGMTIPYLFGYAMHDRTTNTIEVSGEIRCGPNSCEILTSN